MENIFSPSEWTFEVKGKVPRNTFDENSSISNRFQRSGNTPTNR